MPVALWQGEAGDRSSAQSVGAYVIRPGLVYSDNPGGMFGRLVRQVRSSRFIPIIRGGNQVQYLLHEEDLGNLVQACLDGRFPKPAEPITIAHEQRWELKEILGQIARALGKRVSFVPVPWQCVWLALKSLELAGVQTKFRSDSLISMVYQDPVRRSLQRNRWVSSAVHSNSSPAPSSLWTLDRLILLGAGRGHCGETPPQVHEMPCSIITCHFGQSE